MLRPPPRKKKLESLHLLYGEARTNRLIKGNKCADILSEAGLHKQPLNAPVLTRHHPKFTLKSTKISNTQGISERFRPNIKAALRQKLKNKIINNKTEYDEWLDNTNIHKDCWKVLSSTDPEDEHIKVHFNRILHNTLPTKSKIHKHITKEAARAAAKPDLAIYWQTRYPYIQDNLCAICKRAPETIDHLHACTHPSVTIIHQKLIKDITDITDKHPNWLLHSPGARNNPNYNLPIRYGSRGLIPKEVISIPHHQTNKPEEKPDTSPQPLQKLILTASLKIWHLQNSMLFSRRQAPT